MWRALSQKATPKSFRGAPFAMKMPPFVARAVTATCSAWAASRKSMTTKSIVHTKPKNTSQKRRKSKTSESYLIVKFNLIVSLCMFGSIVVILSFRRKD